MNTLQPAREILALFTPFSKALLASSTIPVHSLHLVGSVLTPDFRPDRSDINSLLVLERLDVDILDALVGLGRKYAGQRIAAPLLMTPEYIHSSLDTFPVEFLTFRQIHHTVRGPDLLADLEINPVDLRLQCEREIKSRVFWLQQGYLKSLGQEERLGEELVRSITGCLPIFRAMLHLHGRSMPLAGDQVLEELAGLTGVDLAILARIFQAKKIGHLDRGEATTCFSAYLEALHLLMAHVDAVVH